MIEWRKEWKNLAWMVAGFAIFFWLPIGSPRFDGAVTEALALTRWYAREHVLLCRQLPEDARLLRQVADPRPRTTVHREIGDEG